MITSFTPPPNHHHKPGGAETEGDPQSTMSKASEKQSTDLEENSNAGGRDETGGDDDDEADENSRLVSICVDARPQVQQQTTGKTLRSILRKRTEKRISSEAYQSVQQTPITRDKNVHGANDNVGADHAHDEKDSDYTGDENDEGESSSSSSSSSRSLHGDERSRSNKSVEEENKNNEQQHCRNYSRHQRRDEFFRTCPSTSFVSPLDTSRTETGLIETGTTRTTSAAATPFYGHDQSSARTTCVTFTNDQPIIIHRSSSTPQLGGFIDTQPRSSITYINMKEDLSSTTSPITTMTTSASPSTLGSEFRPVYVSPLKYRPLVGLSANDSRLLLEKRVSLLGKPLVFHPIHKRSPSYRRSQLRIYNFLERPHGCKAILYHTFV